MINIRDELYLQDINVGNMLSVFLYSMIINVAKKNTQIIINVANMAKFQLIVLISHRFIIRIV